MGLGRYGMSGKDDHRLYFFAVATRPTVGRLARGLDGRLSDV